MKKRWGRLPAEFKKQAVERMKGSANVSALAEELGVPRRQLYRWQRMQERAQAGPAVNEKADNPDSELNRLRRENEQLALSLAKRQVEVDFFRGALRRFKDGRPNSTSSGVSVPTLRSE